MTSVILEFTVLSAWTAETTLLWYVLIPDTTKVCYLAHNASNGISEDCCLLGCSTV
jgi:hypothetical protein